MKDKSHPQYWKIESTFRLRKDKRYRAGFLQAAVSFGVITNTEYKELARKFTH